jgi:hypothetical protein
LCSLACPVHNAISLTQVLTPVNVNLNVSQLHLAGSGMTDFAPTLAGVVTFVGNGESDGCTMRFKRQAESRQVETLQNRRRAQAKGVLIDLGEGST